MQQRRHFLGAVLLAIVLFASPTGQILALLLRSRTAIDEHLNSKFLEARPVAYEQRIIYATLETVVYHII